MLTRTVENLNNDDYYNNLWEDGPRSVTKHVNLLHNDLAVAAIQWPDHAFVQLAGAGAQITGKLPRAGIYRAADVIPAVSRSELLATNNDWIVSIERGRPPLPD